MKMSPELIIRNYMCNIIRNSYTYNYFMFTTCIYCNNTYRYYGLKTNFWSLFYSQIENGYHISSQDASSIYKDRSK